MLSDDVLALCNAYNRILSKFVRSSEYFFPDKDGKPRRVALLSWQFRKCWKLSGFGKFADPQPRVYDFRHTYATRWLQDALDRNDDLNNLMPYLSAYMGHSCFSSTAYYIHLLPDRLKASPAIDWQSFSDLIPEVAL